MVIMPMKRIVWEKKAPAKLAGEPRNKDHGEIMHTFIK